MGKKRKLQHAPTRPGGGRASSKPLHKKPNVTAATNGNGPAKKRKQHQPPEKPTIPFEPHQRILLVGEGDLSFSASVVEHHGCTNITATVFEKDEAELLAKYPHAATNIAIIRGELDKRPVSKDDDGDGHAGDGEGVGQDEEASDDHEEQEPDGEDQEEDEEVPDPNGDDNDSEDDDELEQDYDNDTDSDAPPRTIPRPKNNKLLFNMDATKPPASLTRSPSFDTIIFNFPHVGGKSTDVNRQVRYNQELLVSFFTRLALPALLPRGAIVVTLFDGEPYTLWNIRDLARHAGLQVERSFRFQAAAYPGYAHARTLGVVRSRKGGVGGGWRGEERPARSYVFRRKGEVVPVKKKRKRRGDDSSDDDDDD